MLHLLRFFFALRRNSMESKGERRMVANRKVTGKAMSMPGGLAMGGLVSLAVTIVGSVLTANLILREVIEADSVGYCSVAILLLSSVLGARIAVKSIKHRRLYVCALSAAIYYAVLLSITALFFGGQYRGMGVTALVVMAGAGTVALMGTGGKSNRKSKRKRW